MATTQTARRTGRPALNRDRHGFNPTLELAVLQELQAQADLAEISLAQYLELILAKAHQYENEYLKEVEVLPSALPADRLRDLADSLERTDMKGAAKPHARKCFFVDSALAEVIAKRCKALGVPYSEYVRAIFDGAAGLATHRGEQLSLITGGEVRLPRAS